MSQTAIAQQALANATQNSSMANYATIYSGFAAKGIPADEIEPRVNVLTFHAWHALGRQVKKGEHGVKVVTWIPMTKLDANGEEQNIGRKPKAATVFHVSQTEPRNGYSENLWKYALAHPETEQASTPEPKPAPKQQPAEAFDYYSTEFTPA